MRYKIGEEVVLREDLGINKFAGKTVKIIRIKNGDYHTWWNGNSGIYLTFVDKDINHEKTAELKHYSSELEKIVAEKNNRERMDAIEPAHYRKGLDDLYESAYRTRPFNEYRAIMEFVAERYIKRNKTNRVEDLDKAIYTLGRLKEKEMEE